MTDPTVYLPPLNRRPNNRVRLRLPYGDASWRSWLKAHCGELTRPEFERKPEPIWTVARKYLPEVMHALARKYGEVHVITEHNEAHHCTTACQTANPETAPDCECICAGANHGGSDGEEWFNVIDALLVRHEVRRREFVCRWDKDAREFRYLPMSVRAAAA